MQPPTTTLTTLQYMDKHYGKSRETTSLSGATHETKRIYRREWKRNKPHLPKSTSLPVLQLIPKDRPMFWCRQCGFINTLIPLCLWCCWTSQDAHDQFERSMPRMRRATAPPRVYWKRQTLGPDNPFVAKPPGIIPRQILAPLPNPFPSTGRKHFGPRQPRRHYQDHGMKFGQHGVVLCDGDDATPLLSSPLAFDKSGTMDLLEKVPLHTLSLKEGFHEEPSWTYKTAASSPKNPLRVLKTISTKSLRSSHRFTIDLNGVRDPYDLEKVVDPFLNRDSSSPQTPSPLKTLRRKKRFSSPRPSTTLSPLSSELTSLSSQPTINRSLATASIDGHLSASDPDTSPDCQRTDSHPVKPCLRLGHPNRPYYTAIRPNMSRPTSPTDFSALNFAATSTPGARHMSLPTPGRLLSEPIYTTHSATSLSGAAFFDYGTSENELGQQNERDNNNLRTRCLRSSLPRLFSMSLPRRRQPRRTADYAMPFTFAGLTPGHHRQHYKSHHRPGFSLSGETELRMALAATEEVNDGLGEFGMVGRSSGSFRFKDMSRHETGVMRKMNEWKRGFQGLVKKRKMN